MDVGLGRDDELVDNIGDLVSQLPWDHVLQKDSLPIGQKLDGVGPVDNTPSTD